MLFAISKLSSKNDAKQGRQTVIRLTPISGRSSFPFFNFPFSFFPFWSSIIVLVLSVEWITTQPYQASLVYNICYNNREYTGLDLSIFRCPNRLVYSKPELSKLTK